MIYSGSSPASLPPSVSPQPQGRLGWGCRGRGDPGSTHRYFLTCWHLPWEDWGATVGSSWSAEDEEPLGEEAARAPTMSRQHPCMEVPVGTGTAHSSVSGGPQIYATPFLAGGMRCRTPARLVATHHLPEPQHAQCTCAKAQGGEPGMGLELLPPAAPGFVLQQAALRRFHVTGKLGWRDVPGAALQTKGHCAPKPWLQSQSIPPPRPGPEPSSPPQVPGGGMAGGRGARGTHLQDTEQHPKDNGMLRLGVPEPK